MVKVKDLTNYGEMPYRHLSSLLHGKDYVPVSGNGSLSRDADGTIRLRLHSTDVVTARADGTVTLNGNGYRTSTTKQRMQAVLPSSVRVFQDAFYWYVSLRNADGTTETHEYEDGITFAFADYAVRLVHEHEHTS